MCSVGSACTSFAPGHALHLIQARLVAATPAEWTDAIVAAADPTEGTVVVRDLGSGRVRTLWNGDGAADRVQAGEPVAFHERYHALAIGRTRVNVLVLE